MLRYCFQILLFGIAVHFGPSFAQETADCQLFFDHQHPLSDALQKQFSTAGFIVKDLNNSAEQSNADLQRLLSSPKVFYIQEFRREFSLSMTSVSPGKRWVPIVEHPTAYRLQKYRDQYSCQALTSHLKQIAAGRTQMLRAWRAISNPGSERDFSWGHFFLEREHALLEQSGENPHDLEDVLARYDRLLSDFKTVTSRFSNVIADWVAVKHLLFSKDARHITYCSDFTTVHHALIEGCTNCVGFNALLIALFKDAKVPVPAGWELGFQKFNDHVRPVLVSVSAGRSLDISSSMSGKLQDPTYRAIDLIVLILRKGDPYFTDAENRAAKSLSPALLNKVSLTCLPRVDPGPLVRNQLFDFTGLRSCRSFSSHPPPKTADLADQADSSGEEPDDHPGDAGETRKTSKLRSLFSTAMGTFGSWYKSLNSKDALLSSADAEALSHLSADLLPQEKELMLKTLKTQRTSNEFIRTFSVEKLLNQIGVTAQTLSDNDAITLKMGHESGRIALQPFLVRSTEKPAVIKEFAGKVVSFEPVCASLRFHFDQRMVTQVGSIDPQFHDQMLLLPLTDRYLRILQEIGKDVGKFKTLESQTPPITIKTVLQTDTAQRQLRLVTCAQEIFSEIRSFQGMNSKLSSSWLYMAAEKYFETNPFNNLSQQIRSLGSSSRHARHEFLASLDKQSPEEGVQTADLLRRMVKSDLDIKNERSLTTIHDGLLADILTDPDYFYTVAPLEEEKAEILSRPFYPQLKAEIQKLYQKADLDDVHPPSIAGLKCNGRTGFVDYGFFTLDCRSTETHPPQPGAEIANGTETVQRDGVDAGEASGRDSVEKTDWASSDKDLEPSDKPKLDPTDLANMAFEYRKEVDLEPRTWALLFSIVNSSVFENSRYKLLIHYMWRKRLDQMQVPSEDELPSELWTSFPSERKGKFARLSFSKEDVDIDFKKVEMQLNLGAAAVDQFLKKQLEQWLAKGAPETLPVYVENGPPYMRLAFQEFESNKKHLLKISTQSRHHSDTFYSLDTFRACSVHADYFPHQPTYISLEVGKPSVSSIEDLMYEDMWGKMECLPQRPSGWFYTHFFMAKPFD